MKKSKSFLSAHWENLIMVNYAIDPAVLKPYLPKGVELDFYHNKTYVSLVGFLFRKTRLFNLPIPFFGSFEEINLRFYVKRFEGDNSKRGVVFINETVPYRIVAWLANRLYREHYIAIPTKHTILKSSTKKVKYEWEINNRWNHIEVEAALKSDEMLPGSFEEFIFEHYYGYTKINDQLSQEYKVDHPRWLVNNKINFSLNCDFRSMYGSDFSFLKDCTPHSVFLAEGSPVNVKWKRSKF